MAEKKLKRTASKPSMVDGVRDSANQIWLAGLGAFAKAQEEGSKVFDTLVKEGQEVDSKTRQAAEDAAKSVKSNVGGRVTGARKQASDTWDKLEGVFEERVARVLNRLGVPSKQDIDSLNKQIDSLSKELKSLKGESATKPAAKKTTTRRRTTTATKSTAAKSTASKS